MPPLPAIHGVVETILYTDDLERATAFYRDVLGLSEMKGDGIGFKRWTQGKPRVVALQARWHVMPQRFRRVVYSTA
jgi:catechol 2,3-dioxygenase-like lactoylglutathione lyase family enzyme